MTDPSQVCDEQVMITIINKGTQRAVDDNILEVDDGSQYLNFECDDELIIPEENTAKVYIATEASLIYVFKHNCVRT